MDLTVVFGRNGMGAEGSSEAIRHQAAQQIGELAASSVHLCDWIFDKLHALFTDPQWETRVAAACCLHPIAQSLSRDESKSDFVARVAKLALGDRQSSLLLNLMTIDIQKVVQEGAPLLRSGGEEYQYETNLTEKQRKVQAIRQRRILLRRLCGTEPLWNSAEDSAALDLLPKVTSTYFRDIEEEIESSERKASAEQSQTTTGDSEDNSRRKKRRKLHGDLVPLASATTTTNGIKDKSDSSGTDHEVKPEHESLTQHVAVKLGLLLCDLFDRIFDAKWEVRHGALMALRQVLVSCNWTNCVETVRERNANEKSTWIDPCIEEYLVRCICVMALDQFVDYSADGCVSPVREVCAQVFGILLGNLPATLLAQYLDALRCLLKSSSWQTRHGGLLGLKYLLHAHTQHTNEFFPTVFDDICSMLSYGSHEATQQEEVMALAAQIMDEFAGCLPSIEPTKVLKTMDMLWRLLPADRNQVGVLAPSIIQAIGAWIEQTKTQAVSSSSELLLSSCATSSRFLQTIGFLHHHALRTRLTCAKCLQSLLDSSIAVSIWGNDASMENSVLETLLPHVLLQLLSDESAEMRNELLKLWQSALRFDATLANTKATLLNKIGDESFLRWLQLMVSSSDSWKQQLDGPLQVNGKRPPEAHVDTCKSTCYTGWSEHGWTARLALADALGFFGAGLLVTGGNLQEEVLHGPLSKWLAGPSGDEQTSALMVLERWHYHTRQRGDFCESDRNKAFAQLQESFGGLLHEFSQNDWMLCQLKSCNDLLFSEQKVLLARVHTNHARLVETFQHEKVELAETDLQQSNLRTAAQVSRELAELALFYPYDRLEGNSQAFEYAHLKRQDLFAVDEKLQKAFESMHQRIAVFGSSAFMEVVCVPTKKSAFVVKALMNSLKSEHCAAIQAHAAKLLSTFVLSQCNNQRKCVAKIISNLCHSASALVLTEQSLQDDDSKAQESHVQDMILLVRVRGATIALEGICQAAGDSLWSKVPWLADFIGSGWISVDKPANGAQYASGLETDQVTLRQRMHLIDIVVPSLHGAAGEISLQWLTQLCKLAVLPHVNWESRTLQAIANAITSICAMASESNRLEDAMLSVYYHALAVLEHADSGGDDDNRGALGALEVIHSLSIKMKDSLTPFVPILVHFCMKQMNSCVIKARRLAASGFASLVLLLPLHLDLKPLASRSSDDALRPLVERNRVARDFLQGLLQGEGIQRVQLDGVLTSSTRMREYQQHGIDWLVFLMKNHLHGILADDMGLGKTIQMLAAIASQSREFRSSSPNTLAALVVCPPLVVDHWITEASKHFPSIFTQIINYSGSVSQRRRSLQITENEGGRVGVRLMVTTYAILRKDIRSLGKKRFTWVVLDEAHLVRNPKSEASQAVRKLQAIHRFALSGTPIQNKVEDLWSIWEFLMPAYLGELDAFRRDFMLPIAATRTATATAAQKEQAALAINQLHQKVLPFVLRRTKDQVLKELPPKIISNVLVSMTPVQHKIYHKLSLGATEDGLKQEEPKRGGPLTRLQLLRKACVHPALLREEELTEFELHHCRGSLQHCKHSGKFEALVELLQSCNVGSGEHRFLVFGHFKETLDLIESLVLRDVFKGEAKFLRLDGTSPVGKRSELVNRFNNDASIDLLLLTTSIGGLGLTLTGADTVIFMEHSWNPFVDLQAMDRAHRIGQKKVVRVFRLIMKDTLEDHIVQLQNFKNEVAKTVVTESDAQASMNSNTRQVLQLLQQSCQQLNASELKDKQHPRRARDTQAMQHDDTLPPQAKRLLKELGELWDETQYDSLAFPTAEQPE